MKNILKIAILSMVLINCCSDDNNVPNNNNEPTTFEPQNIEIEVLLNSAFSAASSYYPVEDNFIVMHTQNELDNFVFERFFNYPTELESIYFSQYQVLYVESQNVMGSGSTINITLVTEYENEIKVVLENLILSVTADALTFPYEIVKMPKTDKPIVFDTSLLLIP